MNPLIGGVQKRTFDTPRRLHTDEPAHRSVRLKPIQIRGWEPIARLILSQRPVNIRTDNPRGRSAEQGSRRKGSAHDTSRGNDASIANLGTVENPRSGPDPNVVADRDSTTLTPATLIGQRVILRVENLASPRDRTITTDRDRARGMDDRKAIDERIATDAELRTFIHYDPCSPVDKNMALRPKPTIVADDSAIAIRVERHTDHADGQLAVDVPRPRAADFAVRPDHRTAALDSGTAKVAHGTCRNPGRSLHGAPNPVADAALLRLDEPTVLSVG